MSETISKVDVIARLNQLPSLPLIVQEVIASFNYADLNYSLLANKMEQDQGLSAKVLRVANSSFYGLPRQIGSIQEAIVVLGFNSVRSMVLSVGVMQAFSSSLDGKFDRQAYWQHGFRVAGISKALAAHFRLGEQLAFTAGMFHDIGKLVLDLCIPQPFNELLQRQAVSGLSLLELERFELGFDQAEIGAEIIRLWNFPPEIEQVVRHCHQPELQTNFEPLVCLVHVAILLASGISGDELMTRLPRNCDSMLLTWERIEACMPCPDQFNAGVSSILER